MVRLPVVYHDPIAARGFADGTTPFVYEALLQPRFRFDGLQTRALYDVGYVPVEAGAPPRHAASGRPAAVGTFHTYLGKYLPYLPLGSGKTGALGIFQTAAKL